MPPFKANKPAFELAPFLLRWTPPSLVIVLALAAAWHRWSPVSVPDLPPQFELACTGTLSSFVNSAPQGGPQAWTPRYHVDLPHRRVDNLLNGQHIRIGSVDKTHHALWVEDADTKAGRNIVSYFYLQNRLAGSLALDAPGYQAAQVKKATCTRTPG